MENEITGLPSVNLDIPRFEKWLMKNVEMPLDIIEVFFIIITVGTWFNYL